MKQLLIVLLCLLSFVAQSQVFEKDSVKRDPNKYYLKDGFEIGNKADIIVSCVESEKKSGNIKNPQSMCECIFDIISENLTSLDILQIALEEEPDYRKVVTLLPDKVKFEFVKCYMGNERLLDNSTENTTTEIQDDNSNPLNSFRESYIKSCVAAFKAEIANSGLNISEENGLAYCACTFEKIIEKNVSFIEVSQIEDTNSPIFYEVIAPCLANFLLDGEGNLENLKDNETEAPIQSTITGPKEENIPIVVVGNVGRVKLKIGDKEHYFLIDSGASCVIIDSKLERQWLLDKLIDTEDYLKDRTYALADGKSVTLHRFILPELQLGDYVVNNVEVAVFENPNTDLLLGQSFLNQFSSWSINNKTGHLHLEK